MYRRHPPGRRAAGLHVPRRRARELITHVLIAILTVPWFNTDSISHYHWRRPDTNPYILLGTDSAQDHQGNSYMKEACPAAIPLNPRQEQHHGSRTLYAAAMKNVYHSRLSSQISICSAFSFMPPPVSNWGFHTIVFAGLDRTGLLTSDHILKDIYANQMIPATIP